MERIWTGDKDWDRTGQGKIRTRTKTKDKDRTGKGKDREKTPTGYKGQKRQ
jgi:hypothetical protein